MHPTSRAVVSLLFGVALLTAGNALLGTLVSLRMTLEGFPRLLTGFVMSAYFVGFVLAPVLVPRVIDRVGHIRAFAAFAATAGAAAAAQALVIAAVPWIALRALVGFAMAGELMVAESWLNSVASAANRGRVFSLYMVVIYLAFGSGQLALIVDDPAGQGLFLLVALFLSVSIVPIVLTRATAPTTTPTERLPFRRIYEQAPLGLMGAFVAGISVGAIQSIGPQFASELGLSVSRVSSFMSTFFLSGMLLQWPAGHLSDRMDRRSVLASMALLTAVVLTSIAVLEAGSFRTLMVFTVIGGGAVATLYPLSVAHANDRLPEESVVAITATLLLANGLGAIAGPIVATATMLRMGPSGLFYTSAAPCIALAVYATLRVFRHARVDQARYEYIAQTTPVVLELDPRARTTSSWERTP